MIWLTWCSKCRIFVLNLSFSPIGIFLQLLSSVIIRRATVKWIIAYLIGLINCSNCELIQGFLCLNLDEGGFDTRIKETLILLHLN
ncbi:hypothetical protein SLEP1_g19099 [Rubroshorea leprosula]|nr:hypothetical protein SLEP1_g19099 [Rubroshorea leprosula]